MRNSTTFSSYCPSKVHPDTWSVNSPYLSKKKKKIGKKIRDEEIGYKYENIFFEFLFFFRQRNYFAFRIKSRWWKILRLDANSGYIFGAGETRVLGFATSFPSDASLARRIIFSGGGEGGKERQRGEGGAKGRRRTKWVSSRYTRRCGSGDSAPRRGFTTHVGGETRGRL